MIRSDEQEHSPWYWLGVAVIGAAIGLLSGIGAGTVLQMFGMP